VRGFVEAYSVVGEFLNKYEADGVTYGEKAFGLVRFFRWLRVVKDVELSPSEFLNTHLQKRATRSVEDRRWALRLALEYSRDNPDLKDKAANYKYAAWFLPVKLFCDYHEAPLTSTKGFFPRRGRRKYMEKPFTAEYVKRILSVLSQRDRAVCLCELQSGQSIKQVLVDINRQCSRVFREIDAGATRIRFDFRERKNNNFPYFSFISRDAIQEIQKWRPLRQQILEQLGTDSPYLFITDTGKPLPRKQFHNNVRLAWKRHGFHTTPLSVRSHGFRKFFEQEASPPERGISKAYVAFMMGHIGNGAGGLDSVGGVYDKQPFVNPRVVENEYAKLEPYLNIFSCHVGASGLSADQQAAFEALAKVLDKYPEKAEKFERFLMDL